MLNKKYQILNKTLFLQDSLLALNKLREDVDLEKSRAKLEDGGHEKELEVSIRARNNAWVISRITRGKELYMVLEKANETLLYASEAVEKFSNRYLSLSLSLINNNLLLSDGLLALTSVHVVHLAMCQ